MPAAPQISPLGADELERLLPLIAEYQRFYGVERPDEARNREFFARFLAPSADGMLLGARAGEDLLGYACLYWTFSSTRACEIVLMNDLFVVEGARGAGVGRALIEASAAVGRERGSPVLEWATEPSNRTAQRLYDRTGAERSEWIDYELEL